ncbi:MAG: hypothetical protein WA323_09570 [Candidatus Nitrosopolaris sp.]
MSSYRQSKNPSLIAASILRTGKAETPSTTWLATATKCVASMMIYKARAA